MLRSKLTALFPVSPPPPAIVLLPGDCFFVRRIPLVAEAGAASQIELALEGLSPFAPAQLYWGSLIAPDRGSALVYATYRKRVSAEEWDRASAVLPDFLALCGPRDRETAVELYRSGERLTVVVWDGQSALPATVLVRVQGDADQVVADAVARAGLSRLPVKRNLSGEMTAVRADDGQVTLSLGEAPALKIAAADVDAADVRDDDFLETRRKVARRDSWLWRSLQAAAAVLILSMLLEATSGFMRWRGSMLADQVLTQSEDVQRIETAQTLVSRIAELGERRLMPMEMLATINPGRPESISFQRTITRGVHGLEIEARTGNAADVGAYENVLRALPAIASVETREIRARDGQTSFVLSLDFKPDAFREESMGGAL